MDLHSTNLLGVFTCNFSPEDYEYKDWYIHSNDILIYRDPSQRLAFSYLLCREDNLNWFCELEEGFVHLDLALQEIHFEVRQHYDWNTRGRPRYGGDTSNYYTYGPKKEVEIFRQLGQEEIVIARQKREIGEQAEIVIARQKTNLLYERIESTDEISYRESATQLEEQIVETRSRLREHWQDTIQQRLRAKLVEGTLPNASAYIERGKAYRLLGQYDQANADFTWAIQLEPERDTAYYQRGILYNYFLEEYEQALNDFSQAIYLRPKAIHAYAERGIAYLRLQSYQRAIADFDHVIALNPPDSLAAPTYVNRGVAYMHWQEYQQAIDDYTRAIELDPTNALCYSNRGEAYQRLAQLDLAIADFELALAMEPNLPDTRDYLTKARQERMRQN
jgi:tetratricopeptide (TPR) repeat protein